MTQRRALVLIVIGLLVAAALRFPNLANIPPGPHHDEAANGLIAAGIGLEGERPFPVAGAATKEPLYFYLAGILMYLLGKGTFALRLTSVFLGIMTIAATYWLGRELLADRRVAVIAVAILAISFWHVLLSRLGFRAIGLPLLQALAVAALFRGLKRDALFWLGAGGAFFALAAYTDSGAWFLLVALMLAGLPLLSAPEERFYRFVQLLFFLGVALLLLIPLLLYFYRYPETVRLAQLLPQDVATFPKSLFRAVALFFLLGDPSARFNLPGRPLFNWLWGGLLVAGWVISFRQLRRQWRRNWYDWQKAAVLLLLLLPFFMMLPVALAPEEGAPANLSALGLIPFTFYLPALGLVTLIEQLADRFRGRDEEGVSFLRNLTLLEGYDVNYTFVVLFILLLGSAFTAQQYFQNWATRSQLYTGSDADLAMVANFLDSVEAGTVYLSASDYHHPTVSFLSTRSQHVKWLLDGRALVLPPAGDALYIYPRSSPRPSWAAPYLAEAPGVVSPIGPGGLPAFTAYTLATSATLPDDRLQTTDANFGNLVRLSAYRVEGGVSGETIPVLLAWEVLAPHASSVRPVVRLEDSWANHWSLAEADAYPAVQWTAGETIIQQVDLLVPSGTPPGTYQLQVSFFDPVSDRRLPHLDEEGRYEGTSSFLAEVMVATGEPPATLPEAPRGTVQEVRPALSFLGYARDDDPVLAGATLPLAIWWYAAASQPPLTVRLTLTRVDNTGIILLDTRPVHETYPFSRWSAPQFVIDEINPRIPPGLEEGNYRLELHVLDEKGDRVFVSGLGRVTVAAGDHTFTLPSLRYPLSASFAGELRLVGHDLVPVAGDQYTLTLAWQALQPLAADYAFSVRLLDADGTCCLWQEERMPGSQFTPTGRWLLGEVIVETYTLDVPAETGPGRYSLAVSVYHPETGRPLQVRVPGLPADDAVYLRPLYLEP